MTATIATIMILVLYINDVPKEWMGHHENKSGEWVEMGMGGCLKNETNTKKKRLERFLHWSNTICL